MANDLVWYGKKRETSHRREDDFLRMIEKGGTDSALLRAAGELRASRVRALMAEYSRLDVGDGRHSTVLVKLQARIEEWSARSLVGIVEDYRSKASHGSAANP